MICTECLYDNAAAAVVCFNCGRPPWVVMRNSIVGKRYEVLGVLGDGGMGVVYKARDRTLDELVALKVLRPEFVTPELAVRFHSEIKLARRVRHKNVCAIHEYGEDGRLRYIAMEFVEGVNLRELVAQGPIAPAPACGIALQILSGLGAVHDLGIIHRDLKAANIMRDTEGVIRLMDFGLATLRRTEDSRATRTISLSGTPEYMSPEQVRGERGDFQSDIYAVGIVLFEMLTGEVPFHGGNVLATMQMQLTDDAPLDGDRPDLLPLQLVPVLRKALAKDAGQRYASARGMATALRLVLETLATPAPALVPTLWENGSDLEPASEGPGAQDQAEVLRALVLRLSVGDVPERCVAALTLGRMGSDAQVQDAVPALVEALNDPHPHVAEAAAGALRRIAGTPALATGPPTPVPIPTAAEPPPVIDLIDMLRHPDATLRLIAVEALGESRSVGRDAIPILVEVLEDKDEEVGREAARALGKIGAVAAVPSLVVALSDAPEIVRVSAAEALGRMGPRATVAIPGLIAALEHADDEVSDAAAHALLTIGLGAAPALIEAVPDHNERLSLRAAAVLTKVVTASAMRWVERVATAVRPGA